MSQMPEILTQQCHYLATAEPGQFPEVLCRRTGRSGKKPTDSRITKRCPLNWQQKKQRVSDCRSLPTHLVEELEK